MHVKRLPTRSQGKMSAGPSLVADLHYLLDRAFDSGFCVWVVQSRALLPTWAMPNRPNKRPAAS